MTKPTNRKPILLALLLASAAALVVYALLSNQNEPAVAAVPTPEPAPMVDVLVAARDVPSGAVLDAAVVRVQPVPPDLKNAQALARPEEAVGRAATVDLVAGEQLLSSRLAEPAPSKPDTFAAQVPVGKRAVSVVFDEVIGSGGLVQPGDRVDVIAYLEIEVDDPEIQGKQWDNAVGDWKDKAGSGGSDSAVPGSGASFDDLLSAVIEKDYDYKQYVSTYVLQDVEVLAVAQALTPGEPGMTDQSVAPAPTPEPAPTEGEAAEAPRPTPPPPADPVPRPEAKSVTLAVTPEQAQRLMLAVHTVKKEQGGLRLAMRAPGDTTTFDLRPAQLGNIPLGDLLGDVDKPMVPTELVITAAEFAETELTASDLLSFTATVKNVSNRTIPAGDGGPPSGYEYAENQAYDAAGYFADPDDYRIGLNVAGAAPTRFPWRWSLIRDLEPGQSATITGAVRLDAETGDEPVRYWLGVVLEPNLVVQDGVAVAEVTVEPVSALRVTAARAPIRAEPDAAAETVLAVAEGTELEAVERQDGWFRVRSGSVEGWIEAGAVEPVADDDELGEAATAADAEPLDGPAATQAATPIADAAATPAAEGSGA